MTQLEPYNPLDEKNLGISVAEALLKRDAVQLDKLKSFGGSGLYALYYVGSNPTYRALAAENVDGKFRWPIYVGKAEGARTRKGVAKREAVANTSLYSRIKEHRESIQLASNLDVSDFFCRALVVNDIWIPLGEALILANFSPPWNRWLDGFGNHDPGSGRYNGFQPRWDVLHPGRPWAVKCKPRAETAAQLDVELRRHLANTPIPKRPEIPAL